MTRRYFYKALVAKVIDGDSIEVLIDLGMKVSYLAKLRLNGIDTPSIHRPKSELEKEAGSLVSSQLELMIDGRDIYIKTYKQSKYGDYLADIYLNEDDEKSINQTLIEEGYAREYYGETKTPWEDENLKFIVDKFK